jgi:hypothetical protein
MEFSEALLIINQAVFAYKKQYLSDLQVNVFQGSWSGKSYENIAKELQYTYKYISQQVGPQLWNLLSQALGEEVSKTNFRAAVERQRQLLSQNALPQNTDSIHSDKFGEQECQDVEETVNEKVTESYSHSQKLHRDAAKILPNILGVQTKVEEQPQPLAELELPMGQVSLNSGFYVERPPIEERCYQEILQPGALIRIKAPGLMGKTSLMARILAHARQHNYQTVTLSLDLADNGVFSNLDRFLRWFCEGIGRRLKQLERLDDYWTTYGSKDKTTAYFEECLLEEITSPLVIGLDGVDRIFPYREIADDFFSLLRAWYEYAKYGDYSSELWKKLRLVLVHSKEVYIPLDINQSPFNVGLSVELQEFSQQQVEDLVWRHKGLNYQTEQVEKLMQMLGGHPYLVRLALYHIQKEQITLESLLQTAHTEVGIYSDHLRRHLHHLRQHPEIVTAYKQVVTTPEPVELDDELVFKLHSMGLVVHCHQNQVTCRCDLYRQYFAHHLSRL